MDLDNINIGLAPDDGTGDKLRDAFIIVNENFDELELKTEEIDEELLKKDLLNTGYIDGLHLSINTDNTKFDISTGNYAVNLDGNVSLLIFDELIALTPAFLTTANSTYIGLNVNKQVIQQSSPFTNEQRRSICPIGAVIHSNRTVINTVNQIKAPLKYTLNQLHDVIKVLGSLNLEGNTYSANGVNLQVNKSAGVVFALGINSENPLNPHQLSIPEQLGLSFRYRLQDGTEYSDRNTIDPTNYDLNGVLTPLHNNNKWSVQHINLFQSGLSRIQYGQHQYNSLEEAEQKIKTESFITETNIADNAIFRCYLIVKKDTTNLSDSTQAKFIPVDKWGNVFSVGASTEPLGKIRIIDKLGEVFTDLATASAYVSSFTLATITNESFSDGVYYFTVPNGTGFAQSTFFLGDATVPKSAYIEDTLGLINAFGASAFWRNSGNNILGNCSFGSAFFDSTGNNTLGNCTFSDAFAGSSGDNTFGNCTFGNVSFSNATGNNKFRNILLAFPTNTFGETSTGRFEIYGNIGTTEAANYTNFFLTSSATIWADKSKETSNGGNLEGDLATAQTNGSKLFFGYVPNLNVAFTDIVDLGGVTGAVSIDWSLGVKYKLNLTGSVTITQTNYASFEGQKVQEIQITSSDPSYTITWVDVDPLDFTDVIDFTTSTTYNNVSVRLLRSNIFQSNNLVR